MRAPTKTVKTKRRKPERTNDVSNSYNFTKTSGVYIHTSLLDNTVHDVLCMAYTRFIRFGGYDYMFLLIIV